MVPDTYPTHRLRAAVGIEEISCRTCRYNDVGGSSGSSCRRLAKILGPFVGSGMEDHPCLGNISLIGTKFEYRLWEPRQ